MKCPDCSHYTEWKDIHGNRFLFCKKCGSYWKVTGKNVERVNPFVEEYKGKYNVTTAVQVSKEHQPPKQSPHKSRGRVSKQETNLSRKQHEEDSPSM